MGLYPDDEDELIPRVPKPSANDATAPATLRGLAPPGSTADLESRGGARAMPKAEPSPLQQRTTADQGELSRLQTTGSGISQVKNPVGRGLLRGLETVGQVLLPGATPFIPGTEAHHNLLMRQQTGRIGEDLGEQQKEANVAHTGAETEETQAHAAELNAQPGIKEAQLHEKETEATNKHQTELRKLGLKTDATGNVIPLDYGEMSPAEQAAHDLKESQKEAMDAKAELDRMRADPNNPVYQLQLKRLQVAQTNAANASRRLGLSEEQFANKVNEQNLVKPSGQTQSRGSAAQTVLQTMPRTIELIKKNAATMGPLLGRIAKGEIAIGNVDPETAELYTGLKSLYALQPAVHGFRNAEFVKDFEHAIGNLERNPEAVIAGLEGLRPTLEEVAKEGKTFHKRIVEGQDGGTSNHQGPAIGTVEGGYKFKGGNPADQKNWEKQ